MDEAVNYKQRKFRKGSMQGEQPQQQAPAGANPADPTGAGGGEL